MLPHLVLLDLSPFMFLRLRLDPVLLFVVALKHGAGDFGLFCLIILRVRGSEGQPFTYDLS
jgi:hypothetical protein